MTALVLTRDRPELALRAVRSVTAATLPVRVLVIDNNSDPSARGSLAALAAADARIELRLADRNLGCACGRRLGVELLETELVLFLDDDAELIDGALEHMLADLDAHPDAAAVTALVVGPRGDVQHCGGWMEASEDAARFGLDGTGLRFDDPSVPASGPSGWAPGTASLVRSQILREVEIDGGMTSYYEDNDWCYRVEQRRPGSFRRCREALVLHHHDFASVAAPSSRLVERYETVERLATQAHFFRANGVLLDVDLAATAPELRGPAGETNLVVARLLMELIAARGVDWTVVEWMNDSLSPLLAGGAREERIGELAAHAAALGAQVAGREAQVAEVTQRAAERYTRVAALERQVSAIQAHAAGLEARNGQLDVRAAELQAQVDGLAAHATGLQAQVEASSGHAAGLEALNGQLEARAADLQTQIGQAQAHAAGLEAEQAQTRAHLAWLNDRHLTLCAVEAGGWWKLRSQLLPLLRVASSLRRAVSKRA